MRLSKKDRDDSGSSAEQKKSPAEAGDFVAQATINGPSPSMPSGLDSFMGWLVGFFMAHFFVCCVFLLFHGCFSLVRWICHGSRRGLWSQRRWRLGKSTCGKQACSEDSEEFFHDGHFCDDVSYRESFWLGMSHMHNGNGASALTKKCGQKNEMDKKRNRWIVILYDDIPL